MMIHMRKGLLSDFDFGAVLSETIEGMGGSDTPDREWNDTPGLLQQLQRIYHNVQNHLLQNHQSTSPLERYVLLCTFAV